MSMQGMTRGSITLIAASALALAAWLGTAAPAPAGGPEGAERAVVELAPPSLPVREDAPGRWRHVRAAAADGLADFAEAEDLEVAFQLPETGQLVVDLNGESLADLRARLAGEPDVRQVSPERPVELRFVPNDPVFATPDGNAPNGDFAQWHLRHYGAERAWDFSKGVGAEVAVIDSGIDAGHPDLASRITGQVNCDPPPCIAAPADDGQGHGTHVSGLACADSDSGFGLASVGFDCGIYAIAVELTCPAVAASITAAANRGSDAINMSLGGCDSSLNASLAYAWAQGTVPVAAGANEPTPSSSTNYPAQYIQPEGTGPNLSQGRGLVVTSAKYNGTRSAFAQKTSGISIAAHGSATDMVSGGQQGILSTWPAPGFPIPIFYDIDFAADPVRTSFFGDDRFAYLAGTSMAAPQVAGLVALMRAAKPAIANSKVVRLIKQTATGCGKYGNGIGWGLIQADVAVGAALDRDADPPGSQVITARRSRGKPGLVNLRLKRFDKTCLKDVQPSGVKTVKLFVSRDGGKYKRFKKTKLKKARFRGRPGHRYRFYSVAVDKAGNTEDRPLEPDARVRLARK
jgi:subtilisin family serine protease